MKWEPIGRADLEEIIARDLTKATDDERALFERVAVPLTKWALPPWGDLGGGFWVVARMDDRVLWYNDIEDGFNVSRFVTPGRIPENEYWCNHDELRWALAALAGKPRMKLGPPKTSPGS